MKTRTVSKEVRVDDLFNMVGVDDVENAQKKPAYSVRVKGPTGYERVRLFFRTDRQAAVRVYFRNGSTLECSWGHMLMSDGEWTKVSDLEIDDTVRTETGYTAVKRFKEKGDKILYDMSVESSHAYFSNDVLSHNSWALATLGHACMMNGGLVAHYTLELDDKYTGRRYDSIAGGFSPNEVPQRKDEIRARMETIPGEVSIKKWPAKSVTVQSIHAHFERLSTLKKRPDLIVLDYADLLKSGSSARDANSYQTMGDIYTDLRRMSGELDVPVWTVSQTNREGSESEVITADMIADSFQKVMISDFVASISRTSDDKVSNTARVHLIKNRFGPDGMTLPAMIDTSCGNIEIYEPGSDEARQNAREAKLKAQKKEDRMIGELYDQFAKTGTIAKNEKTTF